ncbi:hypothetical protein C6A85_04830, partial [Mycobacterium sp. ITM-2017-0098]
RLVNHHSIIHSRRGLISIYRTQTLRLSHRIRIDVGVGCIGDAAVRLDLRDQFLSVSLTLNRSLVNHPSVIRSRR